MLVQIVNVFSGNGVAADAGVGISETNSDATTGQRNRQIDFFTDFSFSP
jgi:hypothetical protein